MKKYMVFLVVLVATFSVLNESVGVMIPSSWTMIPEGHHLAPRSPISRIKEATIELPNYFILSPVLIGEVQSGEELLKRIDLVAESLILQAPLSYQPLLREAYHLPSIPSDWLTDSNLPLFDGDLAYGNSYWVSPTRFLIHWDPNIESSPLYVKLVKIKSLLVSLVHQARLKTIKGEQNFQFHFPTIQYISSVNALLVLSQILNEIPDELLWSEIKKLKEGTSKSFVLQQYKALQNIKFFTSKLVLSTVAKHTQSLLKNTEMNVSSYQIVADKFFRALGERLQMDMTLKSLGSSCLDSLVR